MKIVYSINGTYNSGGMEKVLCHKANYFSEKLGYEVTIITTEQKGRPNFFNFSNKIKFIDLGINYDDDNNKNIFIRLYQSYKKRKIHFFKLMQVLEIIKPDICISMFDRDFSFLYKIKDGSKKILEFHFCKKMKVIEQRNIIMKVIQYFRINTWGNIVKKYDKFVVLTEEDKNDWGKLKNITVIPNSISLTSNEQAKLQNKNILSIGRASYQKGFDLLLKAWAQSTKKHQDWQLTIVGGGNKDYMMDLIKKLRIGNNVILKQPTTEISKEYLNASIYVMSSRYEGLPMVLIEALNYGLPIVSFACPCGPKDVIGDNIGGILVEKKYNIKELSCAINRVIENKEERLKMGDEAVKKAQFYSEKIIMKRWTELFAETLNL
ncbi:glycosyltransferase family 4 protein [Phocaeicola plebeius]|uniref:glycosyltransferase family 4 protein n=1 Tax=Phocaeicola plebeius TaxID=310297 RepID=UPI0026E97CBD|nr:glycosyltransferase family 4 protein [Phocaeicola plebeius]